MDTETSRVGKLLADQAEEIVKLKQQIEQLREALDCYTCDCKEDVCKERYLNCGQAARYALEGKHD